MLLGWEAPDASVSCSPPVPAGSAIARASPPHRLRGVARELGTPVWCLIFLEAGNCLTSEIGADSARSRDGRVVPKSICSFAAKKLVQATAALLSVGLMLNWRRTALLASLSLTGRFSPVWEAGEGGEGWCWTLAIAGEERRSQEASALPRGWPAAPPPPLGTACAAPAARQRGAAPRGCSHTSSAHPLAPASTTGEEQRPSGAVGCTTPPSDFISPPCSVAFSTTPSTALHTACPAWQHPSCCQTAPCEPTEGLQDTGCRMPAFSPCPALSQRGTAAPTHSGRMYTGVPPGPRAIIKFSATKMCVFTRVL